MLNENAKKWIEALRSGNYRQGVDSLATIRDYGDIEYCCLGVACELYAQEHDIDITESVNGTRLYYGDQEYSLPTVVKEWLGLADEHGTFYKDSLPEKHKDMSLGDKPSLEQLNDNSVSFDEIADFIESEPGGLFE